MELADLSALERIGWSSAVALLALVALAVILAVWRRGAARERRAAALRAERAAALRDYRAALDAGDPEKAALAKRRLDALGVAALLASACLLPCGCRHARPAAVPVGRYVQCPEPGATVPPLPEGEARWWLLSAPTGFRLVLPASMEDLP